MSGGKDLPSWDSLVGKPVFDRVTDRGGWTDREPRDVSGEEISVATAVL
ncbi:MAG: hypothetical protein ACO31I_19915 [Prochlorotrichaceae cyanobacterium]